MRSVARRGAAALACASAMACASAPRAESTGTRADAPDAGASDPGVADGDARDSGIGGGPSQRAEPVAAQSGPAPDAGVAHSGPASDAGAADSGPASDAGVADGAPAPDAGVADGGQGPRAGRLAPDGGASAPSPEVVELLARASAKAQEGDPDSLAEAARLWESAAEKAPHPEVPLLFAARARRERVLRSTQSQEDVMADAVACAADAKRGLQTLDPALASMDRSGKDWVLRIGLSGAELLYLDAVCTGRIARTQGFTNLVDRRQELIDAFERVAQLLPDLDSAGAERELGRLYAALPLSKGGDLAQARRHLDAAVERAPRAARNHVAYAMSVAVKAQDRALFESQLRAALDAQPDDAEARELLSRIDELFGPAEAAQPIPGGPGH